jgi:hypothetical protein
MTFNEAKKTAKSWRLISLLDSDKETLVPFNNYTKESESQLKEIENIAATLPNGRYYLALKSSLKSKEQLLTFDVGTPPAPKNSPDTSGHFTELHAENLRLAVRNKELETLNEIQEEKIRDLLRINAELEDEIEAAEEMAQPLADAAPSIWETLALSAAPALFEKFGLTKPLADALPIQTPDQPGGGTPPPVPGVNVTTARRFVITPAAASVPAQVVANVQQGRDLLNGLGELDRDFLINLAWILQPLNSGIDNDLGNGQIKWQNAKAVKTYLQRLQNFDSSPYEPASEAILNAAGQIGFLLYGGAEMLPIAGTIEQNFENIINWASK